MKDIVDNSYRGVHKTSQSILEKTPTQALNRIGREITKGADGKIINIEKYDAEEQLFRELAGSSKAKNLDEIEDGMTFDGSGNGVGKEHTDSITDILDELKETSHTNLVKEKLDAILSRIACHGSIRSGRIMRAEEMNALLREMEVTPHSGQCNHGRPTYVELKLSDIEKLFGRT